MKRLLLATALVFVCIGSAFAIHSPVASASAIGKCPKIEQGDPCTVLTVQLTGAVPTSGVTVDVKRVQAVNENGTTTNLDNEFLLAGANDFPVGHATSPVTTWTGASKLGTNQYTSYYGIYHTNNCSPNGATQKQGYFNITATANGKTLGTAQNINLCVGGPNVALINGAEVVGINIAANQSTTLAGLTGNATYNDTQSNSGTTSCASDSIIVLTGGPSKLTAKDGTIPINDNGKYTTELKYPAGSGYTAAITCYDSTGPVDSTARGVYTNTVNNITLKPGVLTTVNFNNTALKSGGGGEADPAASSSDSSGPTLDCSITILNPVSWFLCPLATAMMSVAGGLDNAINNYLSVDTSALTPYKAAWQTVRNISLGVMIIGALIAIVAQALGFELLDAYTIRKVLPRLAVVAIGITLSWPLMMWFIQLTNDLGTGIRQLIYAPFPKDTYRIALGGGGTVVLGLIGTGAILALGFMALLSFAATAALAAAVAFLVLTLRQIVVVMLVIFAPLAIVCYILPNTQKMWKLWWDTFSKTLLMFPIITGIIAIGRVFSAVSTTGPGGAGSAGVIQQLVGFVAYFAPYFMIPFTFRLAGGAIASLGGLVNDRSRGGFDRLKKFRGNKIAQNTAAMSAGTRTNNRAFNALTSRASTSRFGLGKQGRAAYEQKQTLAAMEHAKTAGGQAVQHNDDALRALTYGSSAEARANMKRDFRNSDGSTYTDSQIDIAIAAAKSSGGFGRARQVYAAQQLSATGTGYNEGAIDQVAKTIARVSHGNEGQIASLAGNINSGTKSSGRHDLAPGFGALNKLARQEAGVEAGAPDYAQAADNAWNSASLYQHANDKPQNIKAAIAHYTPQLTSSSGAQRERAAVFFNELKSMQPNASGEVKNQIQTALEKNRSSLNNLFDPTHVDALPASPLGIQDRPVGGGAVTMKLDPITGNYEREVAPPTHMEAENAKQRVERLSRTYERPDPNTI